MFSLDDERFFVEYADGDNTFTMYWNVNNKHISKFWKKTLLSNYIGDNNHTNYAPLDKRYMNRGFPNTKEQQWSRSIQHICDELNDAINILNTRLVEYPLITQHFTPERVWDEEVFRDDFNQLHHHFEKLIGQTWSMSDLYKDHMDNQMRWATHCLNNACHEIELYVIGVTSPEESFGWTGLSFNTFSWDGVQRKQKIVYDYEDKHINDWQNQGIKWGSLVPYYSQLGKTLREVFEDGDEYIDDGNISQHCLMTGEVQICLTGPGTEYSLYSHDKQSGFVKWLEDRGLDYNDPRVGAGDAIMGTPALELFPDVSWQALDDIIKKCDNITAIGFADKNLNVIPSKSTRYDYTWQEQYKAEKKMFSIDPNARGMKS